MPTPALSAIYDFYAKQKAQLLEQQRRAYTDYVAEKKRLEEAVRAKLAQAQRTGKKRRPRDSFEARARKDFFAGKAKKVARQAKAMVSRLEKLEKKEKPQTAPTPNLVMGPGVGAAARILIEAEGLARSYGQRLLFEGVGFSLERGQRVALIGENGAGKTTLLRIIVGDLTPDRGVLRVAPGVRMGYLDQRLRSFDDNLTILEEVMQKTDRTPGEVRTVLASLLFRGAEVETRLAEVSARLSGVVGTDEVNRLNEEFFGLVREINRIRQKV